MVPGRLEPADLFDATFWLGRDGDWRRHIMVRWLVNPKSLRKAKETCPPARRSTASTPSPQESTEGAAPTAEATEQPGDAFGNRFYVRSLYVDPANPSVG